MSREISENVQQHKSSDESSKILLADIYGSSEKQQEARESKAAEKSTQEIHNLLGQGKEDQAREKLYQIWKKNFHGDKSEGNVQQVINNLEKNTQNADPFHKLSAKRLPDGKAYQLVVGVDFEPLTHKIFDNKDFFERDQKETEAASKPEENFMDKLNKLNGYLQIPNIFEKNLPKDK